MTASNLRPSQRPAIQISASKAHAYTLAAIKLDRHIGLLTSKQGVLSQQMLLTPEVCREYRALIHKCKTAQNRVLAAIKQAA